MNHPVPLRPANPWLQAAAGLLCALGLTAAAADPVPLAAFFGPAEIGDVAISPSGQTLAMTVPGKKGRMELVAADLAQAPLRFRSLAWMTDYDVASVYWLNDKRLVFDAYDSQAGEWAGRTGLWAVDADGENGQMLIDPYWMGFRAQVPGSRNILPAEWALHSVPAGGSDDVLVEHFGWSTWHRRVNVALARLNTRVPMPRRLGGEVPEGANSWFTDAQGTPQVLQARNDGQDRVYRRQGEAWLPIGSTPIGKQAEWEPAFVLQDQLFVSAEPAGSTGTQLRLWDAEHGAVDGQPILAAPGYDVGDSAYPLVDGPSGALLGWRYRLDTLYTRWIDADMARWQAAIDRALPGRVNLILCSHCLDAPRLLVRSLSDREPPAWVWLDRTSGRLQWLGSAHPDVPAQASGRRSLQRISARDGRSLPLYLTRPAAAAPGTPLPAVVYVHGGPASRTTLEWSYDAVPQFLASRGWLVLEVDFRGSTGYGSAHRKAGHRQWGLAMQDDLHDALRWAVDQGLVDAGRVCIMGASYGGYAALMGPVRHPGDYRCAVSWVAPTNLPQLVEDFADGADAETRREIEREFGRPADLRDTSPLHRVAQIKVPVLAAWGEDDRRVPVDAHGRAFRDAARAAGVALEYVEYPKEGHVWLQPATRLDFFGRAEALLHRSLDAR